MSGIYISAAALPELGMHTQATAASFRFWKRLHPLFADATLILVPIHVALDWKWIVNVGRRLMRRPAGHRR